MSRQPKVQELPDSEPGTSNQDITANASRTVATKPKGFLRRSTGNNPLERLVEKQIEEIDSVTKKIELWQEYRDDYKQLKQLIDKMQDKVSHPYKVPIAGTKLAFVKGNIIHTNEFHVLLGDNLFALRSARQSTQIIDRRLDEVERNLKMAKEAKRKTEDWLKATEGHRRDKEEFVEIVETM